MRITHGDAVSTNRIVSDLNVSREPIQLIVKSELELENYRLC